jgi:hypothetical protein
METLIIVGGPGRAGTNNAITYMHLHNEIFGYVGATKGKTINDQFESDWKHFLSFQIPQTGRFGGNTHIEITKFLVEKNKDHPNNLDKYPIIARKMEFMENNMEAWNFFTELGVDLKFVFCMRADFHQLSGSRVHDVSQDWFFDYSLQSFHRMQYIAERFPTCTIDVTSDCVLDDYLYMDKMLGTKPSEKQLWWRNTNPVTNGQSQTTKDSRPRLPGHKIEVLRKAYFETRAKLL